MKINDLKSLISMQIAEFGGGEKIGRLKSTLQQVSTQAITSDERRFAYAVLEHAKNTILNRQDVAKLLPRASNFELSQGKKVK